MNRARLILLLLLWPINAMAEEKWSVQYLANQGGTREIVVGFHERQMTEAVVDNQDGVRVRLGCWVRHERNESLTIGFFAFARTGSANGPFLGRNALITAKFDNRDEMHLGQFEYARGAYWGSLPPQTVAMLVSHAAVSLHDTQSDFVSDFSLAGAGPAIAQIECKQ